MPRLLHPLPALCFLALAACSRGSGSETVTQVAGTITIDPPGVTLEVEPSVEYVEVARRGTKAPDGRSEDLRTLNGHPLVIDAEGLRIGGVNYGSVEPGDHIRIDAEGVWVGADCRGGTPARAADPAAAE